jgi:hypothetical protein
MKLSKTINRPKKYWGAYIQERNAGTFQGRFEDYVAEVLAIQKRMLSNG